MMNLVHRIPFTQIDERLKVFDFFLGKDEYPEQMSVIFSYNDTTNDQSSSFTTV